MQGLINEILQWPVIVQGALGSALFWLVLAGGDKLTRYLIRHSLAASKRQKLEILKMERLRYTGLLSPGLQPAILSMVGLLYAAFGYIIRAIIVLALGFMLAEVLPIFNIIGCLGGLYYLFWAYAAVRDIHSRDDEEMKKRLGELEQQIKRLEK